MSKKLKVGLIGLGGICWAVHLPAYDGLRDKVEIVALCDIVEGKIDAVRNRLGNPDIPGFTDYKELLKVEGLDFVDICTPNYLHSIIAVDALCAGINVEKEVNFVELRGDKAGMSLYGDELKIFTEDNGILQDIYPKTQGRQPHALNIEHFVDVLLNGTEPDFTPTQGVNMIKILEAMYKSAESGAEVRL